MERDYDLFEVLPDGAVIWKETVSGHENAIRRLRELAEVTDNEFRIMHILTNTLIASMKRAKLHEVNLRHLTLVSSVLALASFGCRLRYSALHSAS